MRSSWTGLAVALSLIAGFAPAPSASIDQASATPAFIVAVDHPAGSSVESSLIPIARYTGTEWVNTWPPPDEASTPAPSLAQIPEAWLGGPVPNVWTRWAADGSRLRVTVVAPVRERRRCETAIVLRIAGVADGARDPWAPNAVRIAVNTNQPVEWVRAIAPDHRDAKEIRPVIEREYEESQARMAAARMADWTTVLNALNAARAPMIVETLVGPSIDAGPVIYYFRAIRRVTPPRQSPMAIEVHGWLARATDGTWAAFDTAREIRRGDGQGQHRPLAIFRIGQRMYWLTMLIGYEGVGFAIDDVARGSVRRLVTARDGGC